MVLDASRLIPRPPIGLTIPHQTSNTPELKPAYEQHPQLPGHGPRIDAYAWRS